MFDQTKKVSAMSKNKSQCETKDGIAATSLQNSLRYKKSGYGVEGATEVLFALNKMKKKTRLPIQFMIVEGMRYALKNKPEFQRFAPEIEKAWEEEKEAILEEI